jgi:hypothetical protein
VRHWLTTGAHTTLDRRADTLRTTAEAIFDLLTGGHDSRDYQ